MSTAKDKRTQTVGHRLAKAAKVSKARLRSLRLLRETHLNSSTRLRCGCFPCVSVRVHPWLKICGGSSRLFFNVPDAVRETDRVEGDSSTGHLTVLHGHAHKCASPARGFCGRHTR